MKTFLNGCLFGLSVVLLSNAIRINNGMTAIGSDQTTIRDYNRGDIFGEANFVRVYDENNQLIYSEE
jgi:hypothetical protein